MTPQGNLSADTPNVAGMEDKLMATLVETSREVSHTESFDPEQRAEVYTILEILRADMDAHRKIIGRYASEQRNENA